MHHNIKTCFATLLTAFIGLSAMADTVYKTAWIEDFEKAETYLDQMYVGGIDSAILGVNNGEKQSIKSVKDYAKVYGSAVDRDKYNTGLTVSQELRKEKDTQSDTHYLRCGQYGSSEISLDFMMPEVVKTATDYKLSFKFLLAASYNNSGNTATNGLVVVGTNGKLLATFGVAPDSKTGSRTNGLLFVGDSVDGLVKSDLTSAGRGDYDVSGAWLRVTVSGSESQGVSMSVENDTGTALWSGKLSDEFTAIDSLYLRSKANAYAHYVCLDDVELKTPAAEAAYIWTGAAGDSLWATVENWTVDGAVPLSVPTAVDAVVIPEDAVVQLAPTSEYASLALGANAKLQVRFTAVGESFRLPDGIDATAVEALGPFTTSLSDGVMTVDSRVPAKFVWVGGANGNWLDTANWSVNEKPTAVLTLDDDDVEFPSTLGGPVAVSFVDSDSQRLNKLTQGVDLKLTTGKGGKYASHLYLKEIDGVVSDGTVTNTLTLAGASVSTKGTSSATTNLTIIANIEFAPDTENCLQCNFGNIELYGNLKGSGTVTENIYRQSYGVKMHGDNSLFSGTFNVTVYTGASRDYTYFATAAASSENAIWQTKSGDDDVSISERNFGEDGVTYKFGALNGRINVTMLSQSVFEIGKRDDVASVLTGYFGRGHTPKGEMYYNDLVKVGGNELTFSGGNMGNVTIKGGIYNVGSKGALPERAYTKKYKMTFAGEGATLRVSGMADDGVSFVDPSAVILDSASPIAFDSNGGYHVWATALDASNVGGLVKKGAGTLTLAKTPAYAGPTRIEGGKLVVEDAIDLGETGSTVVVDDPVAACEAGTVYLEATSITGKAALETSVDPKIAAKYKLVKKTIDGKVCLCVGKIGGLAIIIK